MTRQEEIFYKVLKDAAKDGKLWWHRNPDGYEVCYNFNYIFKIILKEERGIHFKEFIISENLMPKDNVLSGKTTAGMSVKLQEELNHLTSMVEEQCANRENTAFHEFMSLK